MEFTATLQDPQDWGFGTSKQRKPCLACKDKSNFTSIHRLVLVSSLLISRVHGIVKFKKLKWGKRNGFTQLRDDKRLFMSDKAFLLAQRRTNDYKY